MKTDKFLSWPFGASFHGGYYQIPGLGRVFTVITNFSDGVLMKTKHGNYILTPEKPEDFVRTIREVTTRHAYAEAGER